LNFVSRGHVPMSFHVRGACLIDSDAFLNHSRDCYLELKRRASNSITALAPVQ